MKNNMSKIDRIIRVIIAIVISALYFGNRIPESWGFILMTVSTVFMLTSLINFCPIYTLLGIRKWEKKPHGKAI
jgi:hypothetical protein